MCEDLKRLERVKNADVFFFLELTSKQKGRAVVLLTSEERIIVKETISRCKMIGLIVSKLTAVFGNP